jgi:hypothetical protein
LRCFLRLGFSNQEDSLMNVLRPGYAKHTTSAMKTNPTGLPQTQQTTVQDQLVLFGETREEKLEKLYGQLEAALRDAESMDRDGKG